MLCNVAFRQCPRIEDVANLVFWMGTVLVVGLGLGCYLDWRLVAHLAGCLVMVLRLGHLWVFFCVLTSFGCGGFGMLFGGVALGVFHNCGLLARLAPE